MALERRVTVRVDLERGGDLSAGLARDRAEADKLTGALARARAEAAGAGAGGGGGTGLGAMARAMAAGPRASVTGGLTVPAPGVTLERPTVPVPPPITPPEFAVRPPGTVVVPAPGVRLTPPTTLPPVARLTPPPVTPGVRGGMGLGGMAAAMATSPAPTVVPPTLPPEAPPAPSFFERSFGKEGSRRREMAGRVGAVGRVAGGVAMAGVGLAAGMAGGGGVVSDLAGVGMSAAGGAVTGSMFGPIGTVVGGIVGLVSGGLSALTGSSQRAAQSVQQLAQMEQELAQERAASVASLERSRAGLRDLRAGGEATMEGLSSGTFDTGGKGGVRAAIAYAEDKDIPGVISSALRAERSRSAKEFTSPVERRAHEYRVAYLEKAEAGGVAGLTRDRSTPASIGEAGTLYDRLVTDLAGKSPAVAAAEATTSEIKGLRSDLAALLPGFAETVKHFVPTPEVS